MKKILLTLCLFVILAGLSVPLAAQDDTIGSIPPSIEPTDTMTVAMTSAIQTKMFMPTVSDNGVVTAEVPITIVQAAAIAPPVSFGAFDRSRIPNEEQAWWIPAYGHVHSAIMLPFADTVSGILTLPVRIVMHDNPGKLHRFIITSEAGSDIITSVFLGDLPCTASVCAWGFDVKLDTRLLKNGCRELRVKSFVNTPDGKQMVTSSGIPVNVQNGGGAGSDFNKSCVTGQLIGRSWYSNMGYTNSIFDHVPVAPVKGIFTIGARAQDNKSSRLLVN